jgi:hypothetical protein
LFRRVSEVGKKAIFFPFEGFFRENSPAICPKKAFKWKENSLFAPSMSPPKQVY